MPRLRRLRAMNSTLRRTRVRLLAGVFARHRAERGDSAGLRLDPEGCHLFRATAKADEKDVPSPTPALTA